MPNNIKMINDIHCGTCDTDKLQVSISANEELVVWCKNCKQVVIMFELGGKLIDSLNDTAQGDVTKEQLN